MKKFEEKRSKKKTILTLGFAVAFLVGVLGTAVSFAADKKQFQQESGILVEEINEEFAPGDPNGDVTEGEPTAEQKKEHGKNPKLEKGIEVKGAKELFAPNV